MIGTIVFCRFDSKGPCGMTVLNDIDDDSATKHIDFHIGSTHCGNGAKVDSELVAMVLRGSS